MKDTIEAKLIDAISPIYLTVDDESYMHNVPEGAESHFKVVIVAPTFDGMTAVRRHQSVYRVLKEEMSGPIHALALHLYTEQEWREKQGTAPSSPNCMGGENKP